MYAKFNEPLVYKFYKEFDKTIRGENLDSFEDLDPIMKLILMNNGTGVTKNPSQYIQEIIEDNFYIYYIYGAKANESNEYFDYINFYGVDYLVIFMDYFDDIITQEKFNNETDIITKTSYENLGNSVYFDAIVKLVEIFIYITNPISKSAAMVRTVASQNIVYASHIIAAKIINQFKTLSEVDIDNIIALDELNELIKDDDLLSLKLIGIRSQ